MSIVYFSLSVVTRECSCNKVIMFKLHETWKSIKAVTLNEVLWEEVGLPMYTKKLWYTFFSAYPGMLHPGNVKLVSNLTMLSYGSSVPELLLCVQFTISPSVRT